MSTRAMTSQPTIDHTVLSPSGRVSKRARAAAMAREAARLFPPGYWEEPAKNAVELAREKAESLLRSAANLRRLAARGMSVRKFARAAERLEAEAAALVKRQETCTGGVTPSQDDSNKPNSRKTTMIKSIVTLAACAALALAGATYSPPAEAQAPQYYFVSVCTVPNYMECPFGPTPAWFGPYPTLAACITGHDAVQYGIFGTWPRTLSTCFLS
jgi:hypothetical protein